MCSGWIVLYESETLFIVALLFCLYRRYTVIWNVDQSLKNGYYYNAMKETEGVIQIIWNRKRKNRHKCKVVWEALLRDLRQYLSPSVLVGKCSRRNPYFFTRAAWSLWSMFVHIFQHLMPETNVNLTRMTSFWKATYHVQISDVVEVLILRV